MYFQLLFKNVRPKREGVQPTSHAVKFKSYRMQREKEKKKKENV